MIDEHKQLYDQIQQLLELESHQALSSVLEEHRSSEIAEIVELLDNDQRRVILDSLDRETAAEVITKVDEATRHEIFEKVENLELSRLIEDMDPDDAADVLGELPETQQHEVLEQISKDDAHQIKDLMSYSEDSAGGIMDPVLVSVLKDATIKEAIHNIQQAEVDEDFFSIFVTDNDGKFIGDVRIRSLLARSETTIMTDLVDTDAIYVSTDTDQEEVRNIFKKNDLIVVPVLDKAHKLVGRITADIIIEVAEEEAAEDLYAMAGTDAAELENFSVIHAARVRMTWLLPCLVGTAVTAIVALVSKIVFSRAGDFPVWAVAMAFAPMIAAISGNAGLQTSAIVICGLATGDLAALRISQVFAREVRIAFLVAISCGLIGAAICASIPALLGQHMNDVAEPISWIAHMRIVYAFATAMFSAIMVATTLGLFLPFLFRKVGIDPAISSGPLVTTANDSISVAIYLTLTFILMQ